MTTGTGVPQAETSIESPGLAAVPSIDVTSSPHALASEDAQTARLAPLPIADWPPTMREALAAMVPPVARHQPPTDPDRPRGANVLGAFAHHPELARAFFTFNGHLLFASTLSERQRELIVLRVAVLRRCGYEWAQHLVIARTVGLTDTDIARVGLGPAGPGWSDDEAVLLSAVDELIGDGAISTSTWDGLRSWFEVPQILDLIFTVGAYEVLAFMMRSLQLPLDADLAAHLT